MQQNFLCPVCWQENSSTSTICNFCQSQLGVMGARNACCPNPRCGKPRGINDNFCGYCGQRLPAICPNCGNSLSPDSRYCPKCSFFSGQGRSGQI